MKIKEERDKETESQKGSFEVHEELEKGAQCAVFVGLEKKKDLNTKIMWLKI